MEQDEGMHTDIEQIHKTNSILNNLEAKLNKYMSKSRIVTQRVPTAMTFLMPNIDLRVSDRSEVSGRKSSPNIKQNLNHTPPDRPSQKPRESFKSYSKDLNLVDQEIKVYKDRMMGRRDDSEDRLEGLYQHKARRLEEEIEELSQRKEKIRSDREILGKENRRLVEVLKEREKEFSRVQEKQKKQDSRLALERSQTIDLKRKSILISLQKERILGEELEKERQDLEEELKALRERSQGMTDYQTKKTSREKPQSKSKVIKKKSISSVSKNYPSHNPSGQKGAALKSSKSKSTLLKKLK